VWLVVVNLQQKLGTAPESLSQRPFPRLGKGPEFPEKLIRHLDLRLAHAGKSKAMEI
jgi:hypothetical protein